MKAKQGTAYTLLNQYEEEEKLKKKNIVEKLKNSSRLRTITVMIVASAPMICEMKEIDELYFSSIVWSIL